MDNWQYNAINRLPIDRGLGVKHHNVSAEGKGINAKLWSQSPGSQEIGLWVYEVSADFTVAGSRAQSAKTRDFYPHNFVQPILTVKAQAPTNYEFNRLSEFVRHTQKRAVFFDQHNLDTPSITFLLQRRGRHTLRNTKGPHQSLSLEGFIPTFAHGAKRFEFAQDFTFTFVVTRSKYGLMNDGRAYAALSLRSWAEIVTKNQKTGVAVRSNDTFITDPTAAKPPLDEAKIAASLPDLVE